MQMQNQLKKSKRMKKSQALLIGSLLVFGGSIVLSWNYLLRMREEVFSEMKLAMTASLPVTQEQQTEGGPVSDGEPEYYENYTIDYSKYYGVLEIPRIGLKRGFYNVGSRYNNIESNVTMVEGSVSPSEGNGNLILMAHSGDSYISFFAYLYRLGVGDDCYITLSGVTYHYQIVDIYDVNKSGLMVLDWNPNNRNLTLVTCTKDSDTLQTVYVAEYIG